MKIELKWREGNVTQWMENIQQGSDYSMNDKDVMRHLIN